MRFSWQDCFCKKWLQKKLSTSLFRSREIQQTIPVATWRVIYNSILHNFRKFRKRDLHLIGAGNARRHIHFATGFSYVVGIYARRLRRQDYEITSELSSLKALLAPLAKKGRKFVTRGQCPARVTRGHRDRRASEGSIATLVEHVTSRTREFKVARGDNTWPSR